MKRVTFGLLLLGFSAGCQQGPAANSSVDSLDQFAGSSVRYKCGGEFTEDVFQYMKYVDGIATAAQGDAVRDVLSAMPPHLKARVFFGGVQTEVVLTENVGKACLGGLDGGKASVSSCHKIEDGKVKILVGAKADEIREGLLRAVGYYLGGVDSRLTEGSVSPTGVLVSRTDSEATRIEKSELALDFLNDLAASKKFSLTHFKGYLPNTVIAAKSAQARREHFLGAKGLDAVAVEEFQDFVYAEAIDSLYCSDASRRVLYTEFPRVARTLGWRQDGMNLSGQATGKLGSAIYQNRGSLTGRRPAVVAPRGYNYPLQNSYPMGAGAPGSNWMHVVDNMYVAQNAQGQYGNMGFLNQTNGQFAKASPIQYYDPNSYASLGSNTKYANTAGLVYRTANGQSYDGYQNGQWDFNRSTGFYDWHGTSAQPGEHHAKWNTSLNKWDLSTTGVSAPVTQTPQASPTLTPPAVQVQQTASVPQQAFVEPPMPQAYDSSGYVPQVYNSSDVPLTPQTVTTHNFSSGDIAQQLDYSAGNASIPPAPTPEGASYSTPASTNSYYDGGSYSTASASDGSEMQIPPAPTPQPEVYALTR